MYLELRYRTWHLLHSIPPKLQARLGKRFCASLKTSDRTVAERRATLIAAKWLGLIAKAKSGSGESVSKDVQFWRDLLKDTPADQQEQLRDILADEARERVERAASRQGIMDTRDPRYQELPELAEQVRFVAIASGRMVATDAHLEDWIATLRDTVGTVQGKRATVLEIAKELPWLQDVTRKAVQQWLGRLSAQGLKASTIRRKLAEVRPYWGWLVSMDIVPEEQQPFTKLTIPRDTGRATAGDTRTSFEASEVVLLRDTAAGRGDTALADAVTLAMWTGARIEEIARLRVEDVKDDCLVITSSKTKSGVRSIPIHSQLRPTIERLVKEAAARPADPFLIGGQQELKDGARAGAILQRFSRLKMALGFGPEKVLHSIRKTVATQMERAGVVENMVADLLGHQRRGTLSFSLYSSGFTIEAKREAIEKLSYPSL